MIGMCVRAAALSLLLQHLVLTVTAQGVGKCWRNLAVHALLQSMTFCFCVLYMLNLIFSADIFLKSFCLKVSCTKKGREGVALVMMIAGN